LYLFSYFIYFISLFIHLFYLGLFIRLYLNRNSDRPDGRGSIPGRGKIVSFCTAYRLVLGHTQPPIQCVPGIKQPRLEADHAPPSSAGVKNGGAVPPLPHISSCHSAQLIKHRDFTFLMFCYLSLTDSVSREDECVGGSGCGQI
jgi:hypothetical protein